MFDDHDREKLRRIQDDLSSEDPTFVRSFEQGQQPSPPMGEASPYTATVWICIAASLMALVSLTLRSPASAVAFFVVAWVAAAREFRDFGNERKR